MTRISHSFSIQQQKTDLIWSTTWEFNYVRAPTKRISMSFSFINNLLRSSFSMNPLIHLWLASHRTQLDGSSSSRFMMKCSRLTLIWIKITSCTMPLVCFNHCRSLPSAVPEVISTEQNRRRWKRILMHASVVALMRTMVMWCSWVDSELSLRCSSDQIKMEVGSLASMNASVDELRRYIGVLFCHTTVFTGVFIWVLIFEHVRVEMK